MSGREKSGFSGVPEWKSHRSGKLGEAFCKEHFGISEPTFEIKSSGARTASVVVQGPQLFDQLGKQYVIVSYKRNEKTISRGPNKGKRKFTETIEKAYEKKVDVFVIRGYKLAQMIVELGLKLHCTAKDREVYIAGKWGLVYRVPKSQLPRHEFEDNDVYTLYCDPLDPPAWTEVAAMQGDLFKHSNNGKTPPPGPKGPVREAELEEEYDDEVPF